MYRSVHMWLARVAPAAAALAAGYGGGGDGEEQDVDGTVITIADREGSSATSRLSRTPNSDAVMTAHGPQAA